MNFIYSAKTDVIQNKSRQNPGPFQKQSFLLQVLVKDTLQTEAKQH